MKEISTFKPNLGRLRRHLHILSRERNFQTTPQGLAEVQAYLAQEFLSYGYNVYEEPFIFAGETFANLIARPPHAGSESRFILGAHFDAVPGSPGADDNASGVATLLETARVYAEVFKGESAVEFAAFNLEEYGMVGSRSYAKKLKEEKVRVTGMLSLEMVAYASEEENSQKMPLFLKPFYPSVGNFIGLVANTKSKSFLDRVEKTFKTVEGLPVESLTLPANGWVFPDARLSDHSPFWDEGFPALLVTDTSFFRNPHYHSEADRIETLNLEFLRKVTEAVICVALSGAAGPAGTD